jgi:hypothetical protein
MGDIKSSKSGEAEDEKTIRAFFVRLMAYAREIGDVRLCPVVLDVTRAVKHTSSAETSRE